MLKVIPKSEIEMDVGEDYAFALRLAKVLKSKTVNNYTYKIYDSGGEVTGTIGGGSEIDVDDTNSIILFGVIAAVAGEYALQFIVTCDDLLPNGVTPYRFNVDMVVVVK